MTLLGCLLGSACCCCCSFCSFHLCCSGMVASWVSQASFEPLGLTIAVAKDRAIESMMQVRGVLHNSVVTHSMVHVNSGTCTWW